MTAASPPPQSHIKDWGGKGWKSSRQIVRWRICVRTLVYKKRLVMILVVAQCTEGTVNPASGIGIGVQATVGNADKNINTDYLMLQIWRCQEMTMPGNEQNKKIAKNSCEKGQRPCPTGAFGHTFRGEMLTNFTVQHTENGPGHCLDHKARTEKRVENLWSHLEEKYTEGENFSSLGHLIPRLRNCEKVAVDIICVRVGARRKICANENLAWRGESRNRLKEGIVPQ